MAAEAAEHRDGLAAAERALDDIDLVVARDEPRQHLAVGLVHLAVMRINLDDRRPAARAFCLDCTEVESAPNLSHRAIISAAR
jgi:hypothetical protein